MSLVNRMLKDLSERERAAPDVMQGISVPAGRPRAGGLGIRLVGLTLVAALTTAGLWHVYGPQPHTIPQPRASLQSAAVNAAPAAEPLPTPKPAAVESAPDGEEEIVLADARLLTRSGMTLEDAYAQGRKAQQAGDFALANERYSDVLLADPTIKPVRESLIALRIEHRHPVGARRVLERGRELDPDHGAWEQLERDLERLEARVASADRAAEPGDGARRPAPPPATPPSAASTTPAAAIPPLAPADAERQAVKLLQDGDVGAAALLVARTHDAYPAWRGYRVLAARIELTRDQPAAALALLRNDAPALAADPEHHGLLASAFQRLNRHEDAGGVYRRLLAAQPDEGRWWAGYGISREALGDRTTASQAYAEALRRGNLDHRARSYVTERLDALRKDGS